jgi:hypothetical protein
LDIPCGCQVALGGSIYRRHHRYYNVRTIAWAVSSHQPQAKGCPIATGLSSSTSNTAILFTARLLPFAEKATQIHQTLLTQKVRIGVQDLQIAAIVLAHNAVLVTANQRHFAQVPGLPIEDWIRN